MHLERSQRAAAHVSVGRVAVSIFLAHVPWAWGPLGESAVWSLCVEASAPHAVVTWRPRSPSVSDENYSYINIADRREERR